jgi:hypothetical protein
MLAKSVSRMAKLLGVLFAAAACASTLGALARPIVPAMHITLTPSTLTVAPGTSVVLTAQARGGEAMRLFVDWSIREGAEGGAIAVTGEHIDGSATAVYTAPAASARPVHVMATVRHFPAVRACATITVSAATGVAAGPAAVATSADGCDSAP